MFWLFGSVLAYATGTNTLWLVRSRDFRRSPFVFGLVQVGRFVFYLGIPYLVLGGWPRRPFQGLLSLQDLGLVGLSLDWPVTRWLRAVSTGLGVGLVALVGLVAAWKSANRGIVGRGLRFAHRPWWVLLVDGLYLQVHWAFYRAALALNLDDLYAGIFGGVLLVYLEWSLSPSWRWGWRPSSRPAAQWLRAALALLTAILFLLTRNLWICLGVHWIMELTFWTLGRPRCRAGGQENLGTSQEGPETL
jgi:hypothetical protein